MKKTIRQMASTGSAALRRLAVEKLADLSTRYFEMVPRQASQFELHQQLRLPFVLTDGDIIAAEERKLSELSDLGLAMSAVVGSNCPGIPLHSLDYAYLSLNAHLSVCLPDAEELVYARRVL
jgi:hypothetical protein